MTNREIDALIAKKVMGWHHYPALGFWESARPEYKTHTEPLPFSTDIADAWKVMEKLGFSVIHLPDGKWWVGKATQQSCYFSASASVGLIDGYLEDTVECDTPAMAICLAALKAVGAEVTA